MQPFFADYHQLLENILNDLEKTISDIPDEALNWVPGPEMSSLGTLVLHTLGATRYLIGDVCLGELSDRDRETEFTRTDLTADQLHHLFADTRRYIAGALDHLTMDDLVTIRAFPGRHNIERSINWSLLHALEHANQHVGHAQVTRQLWDQNHS